MMVLLPMHSDAEKGLMTAPADTGAGASSVTKLNRTSKFSLVAFLAAHDLVDIVPPQI